MSYGTDLAASLARPGGNATGFTLHEYGIAGKWLELLKEIAPRVVRAASLGVVVLGFAWLVERVFFVS